MVQEVQMGGLHDDLPFLILRSVIESSLIEEGNPYCEHGQKEPLQNLDPRVGTPPSKQGRPKACQR
jgi:hypothetical protein